MDVRDYLRAVRRRWGLVAAAIVLGLGTALVVTVATPATYSASVTFFVGTQTTGVADAYQGSLFSQQRIKSYADLLTSDRLARYVLSREPSMRSAQRVQDAVTASAVPDTVLLEATVTDHDRARALRLTEALSTEFTALVQKLETPPGSSTPTVWIDVIAGPHLADEPVAPQPLRNTGLGLVLGLVLGVGAAVLREVLDTSVKTAAGLTGITGAPVLSSVPVDAAARRAPLIVAGSAGSLRAEALRQLRTNLQYVNVDRPARTLVVTSAMPGEGKSTTACNLAIVSAEAGKRVLLVDADLRRPRLAEYLGLEGAVGLTNVLAGQVEVADVVQEWGENGVSVLPSGSIPPNPSELLGSRTMGALLLSLRDSYDMVIVDTPPLLPVTDGALAATLVDGTVLVSRCGKTTAAHARAATEALAAVDAKVLGCVLNMVPRRGRDAYSYYENTPTRHNRPSWWSSLAGRRKPAPGTAATPAAVLAAATSVPAEVPAAAGAAAGGAGAAGAAAGGAGAAEVPAAAGAGAADVPEPTATAEPTPRRTSGRDSNRGSTRPEARRKPGRPKDTDFEVAHPRRPAR